MRLYEISDERLQDYLHRAGKRVDSRLERMARARERLNKGYEIYHADRPVGSKQIVDRFEADTPALARQYYERFVQNYESDVDFDLRLRRSTGIVEYVERPPVLINKTADVDGIQVSINTNDKNATAYATSNGRRLGYAEFDRDGNVLVPYDLAVDDRYRGQGIAAVMYDYAKSLGFTINASTEQTDAGKYFWSKNRGTKRVWETTVTQDASPADTWIDQVYSQYPDWPYGQADKVMVWGEGEDQQFAAFKLKPGTAPNTVEIDWIMAGPEQRKGVGSRAIKELQRQAQESGIRLTLYPWAKGNVSQASLTKLYKRHGFKPIAKGAKPMAWEPVNEIARIPQGDFGNKDTLRSPEHAVEKKPLPGGSGFTYAVDKTGTGDIEIMIFDGNTLAAELDLFETQDVTNAWRVSTVAVDPEYRSQGLGKALYGIALSILRLTLEAGDTQTQHGQRMWLMLNSIPGVEVMGYSMEPTDEYRAKPGDQIVDQNDRWTRYTFPVEPGQRSMRSTRRGTGIYSSQHVSMIARWTGQ
jgi:GNAT superfamily N-acetyltransferase